MADIKGNRLVLGSIYGPNVFDPNFFTRLKNALRSFDCNKFIIGGDWNCTFSDEHIACNIDCLNMASVTNKRHSGYIKDICKNFNLLDPYRGFFPNRKDYTFGSKNLIKKNRSRIDFFIISDSLLQFLSKCEISTEIQTELFDHHRVTMCFGSKNFKLRQSINPAILSHPRFPEVLLAATVDTYLNHADPLNNPHVDLIQGTAEVGSFLETLRVINNVEHDIALNGTSPQYELDLAEQKQVLAKKKNIMPSADELDTLNLVCANDIFFTGTDGQHPELYHQLSVLD